MSSVKRGFIYLTLLIVVISMAINEVESRRLVLRGRRTITRHYYSRMALPAWIIVVLVAIGDLIIGAILYFVLRKVVLSPRSSTESSYQPALIEDTS